VTTGQDFDTMQKNMVQARTKQVIKTSFGEYTPLDSWTFGASTSLSKSQALSGNFMRPERPHPQASIPGSELQAAATMEGLPAAKIGIQTTHVEVNSSMLLSPLVESSEEQVDAPRLEQTGGPQPPKTKNGRRLRILHTRDGSGVNFPDHDHQVVSLASGAMELLRESQPALREGGGWGRLPLSPGRARPVEPELNIGRLVKELLENAQKLTKEVEAKYRDDPDELAEARLTIYQSAWASLLDNIPLPSLGPLRQIYDEYQSVCEVLRRRSKRTEDLEHTWAQSKALQEKMVLQQNEITRQKILQLKRIEACVEDDVQKETSKQQDLKLTYQEYQTDLASVQQERSNAAKEAHKLHLACSQIDTLSENLVNDEEKIQEVMAELMEDIDQEMIYQEKAMKRETHMGVMLKLDEVESKQVKTMERLRKDVERYAKIPGVHEEETDVNFMANLRRSLSEGGTGMLRRQSQRRATLPPQREPRKGSNNLEEKTSKAAAKNAAMVSLAEMESEVIDIEEASRKARKQGRRDSITNKRRTSIDRELLEEEQRQVAENRLCAERETWESQPELSNLSAVDQAKAMTS